MKKLGIVFGLSIASLALSACSFGISSSSQASSKAPAFSTEETSSKQPSSSKQESSEKTESSKQGTSSEESSSEEVSSAAPVVSSETSSQKESSSDEQGTSSIEETTSSEEETSSQEEASSSEAEATSSEEETTSAEEATSSQEEATSSEEETSSSEELPSSSEQPAGSMTPVISDGGSYTPLSTGTPRQATWSSKTNLDLNDTSDADIRSYYAPLETLPTTQRTGTNLLKNLKCILQDFTYHTYDNAWKIYEITDREWALSPAEEMTQGTYNASTGKVTNYQFGSSNSKPGADNPYVRTLYRNRDENGVTVESGRIREWGDHTQTGGTNREHVWCQSRGFKGEKVTGPAGTDIHHLMSGDGYVNGKPHNNNPYGYVDRSKITMDAESVYSYCAGNYAGGPLHPHEGDESTVVFEPQDSDKGDIARACFYMAACYNNFAGETGVITDFNPNLLLVDYATSSGNAINSSDTEPATMGILSDLLEWHRLDPVDEYEIHRNNLIYTNFQHNRNPFIDFPEWVDLIWGDGNGVYAASPSKDVING